MRAAKKPTMSQITVHRQLVNARVKQRSIDWNENIRQFRIEQCNMPSHLTFEESEKWAKLEQKRHVDYVEAFEEKKKILYYVIDLQCRQTLLNAGFTSRELSVGVEVKCLPNYIALSDPRFNAYEKASRQHTEEQLAMGDILCGRVVRAAKNDQHSKCEIRGRRKRSLEDIKRDWNSPQRTTQRNVYQEKRRLFGKKGRFIDFAEVYNARVTGKDRKTPTELFKIADRWVQFCKRCGISPDVKSLSSLK